MVKSLQTAIFVYLFTIGLSSVFIFTIVSVASSQVRSLAVLGSDSPKGPVSQDLLDLQKQYVTHLQAVILSEFKPDKPFLRVIDNRVVIDATAADNADSLLADLVALGLQDSAAFGRMVSGQLPIDSIDKLSKLKSLKFIRPSYAATRVGLTTSQGDEAMRSGFARAFFGIDGTGVTVGTLSDSYDCAGGATVDVANGDLPAGIDILDDSSCPGSDEGRAMMQLIADVAPGASQAFHTAFGGQADFALGITELASVAGADVIVDDVIYFAEPMFQDGVIAQAVDDVVADGVSYFSSAGNGSRQSYESSFNPSGTFIDTGFGPREAHDFDSGPGTDVFQNIMIPVGNSLIMSFQWDEPFFSVSGAPGSTSDMDIFILDDPPVTILGASASSNIGGDPIEILSFTNPGPATSFNIVINNYSGPNPGLMKYVSFRSGVTFNEFDTASGTVFGHASASGAEAVGAAAYFSTPEFGTSPPLLESFSSAGPTTILFDISGTRLGIPEIRDKPEITAPDGTNTTFFGSDIEPDGFPNFFGTSAAAPHAAAVAALMLENDPTLSPADIYNRLESTAIDMDDPFTPGFDTGYDFGSGFGLIQAPAAIGVPPVQAFRVERTSGDVFALGSFIGSGADLAEYINVSEPVEPGDIVELDPDNPQFYRKARENSRLVAGIITSEPGFILGNHILHDSTSIANGNIGKMSQKEESNTKPMIALMGRVPVKAITENGPIQSGDLLTVSSRPGIGMRCDDAKNCEGAIVGKALESLDDGEGQILVLVISH